MAASPAQRGDLPLQDCCLHRVKEDAEEAQKAAEDDSISSASSSHAGVKATATSGHQTEDAGEREAEEGKMSKNRLSSGRHGERIPCPMDKSHCIYALRLQAHLKKCTKARDIAFSHCLPFMQPGANLPLQEHMREQYEEQRQEQQKEHVACTEAPEAAVPLTAEFEAKVVEAYRQCAALLCSGAASAAAVPAADESVSSEEPREGSRQLPAAKYIDKCCGGKQEDTQSSGGDAVLMLRAAADACRVPLQNKVASAEGPSVAFLEAEIERASRLPQQKQHLLLQQLLQQLQHKLNKHQQQMLQLLAVCLYEEYLTPHACDQTLALELGAGKGDLTRWLCCWSAVAVAARTAAATTAAAHAVAEAAPPTGKAAASVRHAGIRCIVVDREARRYCKEAKDKTYRSPNSQRSVNPSAAAAAAAAAEKRNAALAASASASAAKSDNTHNPLLDEEDSANSSEVKKARKDVATATDAHVGVTACSSACISSNNSSNGNSTSNNSSSGNSSSVLGSAEEDKVEPFPPVRLRMDIADFSLSALMNFLDGSVEEFFQLAQALGEGGGPDMKKIDMTLEEHFKNSGIKRVIGVAKHLCGGGSDVALRCTVDSFVGTDFLLTLGFTLQELPLLFSRSSWATGATGRKREVGAMIKRILDASR
ncbi:hypothetical protein Emed_004756 [Eimeria media]